MHNELNLEIINIPDLIPILMENWISVPKNAQVRFKLTALSITNTNIRKFSHKVFSNSLFNDLHTLNLRNFTDESFLFQNAFIFDLKKLKSLTISGIRMVQFEPLSLSGFFNLKLLRIWYISEELNSKNLQNIINFSKICDQCVVSFRGNRINDIAKDAFINGANIGTLEIFNNNGNLSFDSKCLEPLHSLQQLYIPNNRLKSIPRGLFGNFVKNPEFKITLYENNFICDCEMKYINESNEVAKSVGNQQLFNGEVYCIHPVSNETRNLLTDDISDVCNNLDDNGFNCIYYSLLIGFCTLLVFLLVIFTVIGVIYYNQRKDLMDQLELLQNESTHRYVKYENHR